MKKSLVSILALCILSFSAFAQSSKTTGEKTMGTSINVTGKGKTDIILSLK